MNSIVEEKSFRFAIRIVRLHKHLRSAKKEFVLSKQLLRSGTSIGANVAEAQQAQSRADFVSKLNIALKESAETNYCSACFMLLIIWRMRNLHRSMLTVRRLAKC